MVLGQSSALAASMAIDANIDVQQVDVAKLQQELKANPLADGSTPEILVDNEDKSGITTTGVWTLDKSKAGYGPSYLVNDGQTKDSVSVRFTPEIARSGRYQIYTYFPRLSKTTSQLSITVADGKISKGIIVKPSDIVVVGQTSGEWVSLGEYELSKGKTSYVEIAAKQPDGPVVADAVLFVPILN